MLTPFLKTCEEKTWNNKIKYERDWFNVVSDLRSCWLIISPWRWTSLWRERRTWATKRRSGTGSRWPRASTRRPRTGTRRPGASTRRPGKATRRPGTSTRRPGAGTRRPGTRAWRTRNSRVWRARRDDFRLFSYLNLTWNLITSITRKQSLRELCYITFVFLTE